MNWQSYYKSKKIATIIVFQFMSVISSLPSGLIAQPASSLISLEFPPTNERGAPESTTGGGTRSSSCVTADIETEEISLTPLMPTRQNIGQTATTNPALYWYIPQNTAELGEFLVKDNLGNEVYSANFKLPATDGIIKLGIPQNAALKTDRDYFWTLSLVCNSQDRQQNYSVDGVIQPTEIDLSLRLQLEGKKPLEQAKIYAQQRLWHDALNIVAQLSTDYPEEWEELLESINLGKIAKKPILECCTVEKLSVSYLSETLN